LSAELSGLIAMPAVLNSSLILNLLAASIGGS
jgi:hypothetical protein